MNDEAPTTPTGESRLALVRRARRIGRELADAYPDAHCELVFDDPLQLLVATVLSAQCTDERVNAVTPALFAKYRSAADFAGADRADLEEMIRSTGFFRAKANSILGLGQALCDRHGGQVPNRLADLVTLPGVGRKTANVVLGNAFDIDKKHENFRPDLQSGFTALVGREAGKGVLVNSADYAGFLEGFNRRGPVGPVRKDRPSLR